MTSSPDLIRELEASRPTAPAALRARVRELAAREPAPRASWPTLHLPTRRLALVALPAAAALALASAGVLGLARSDGTTEAFRHGTATVEASGGDSPEAEAGNVPPRASPIPGDSTLLQGSGSAVGPASDRAQRVSATLTVEVSDSDAVSRAAQQALDLTRRLGGHVLSASVTTGESANAALTVRVPVDKVQAAIVQLSALGRIVSQQVTIDDLQESLDALRSRARSLRSQIALVTAKLESESLDTETRARLETRLENLRAELLGRRHSIEALRSEARMSTIQLTVVTPDAQGVVPAPSKLDRTLDEALNVLVWEGVVALAVAIVAAPFLLVALAACIGRRVYRRREDDRLLAT